MHVARQRIISNRSLLQRARESDVPQYILAKPFTPKMWIPYNFKFAKRVIEPALADTTPSDARRIDMPLSFARKRSADEMLEVGELVEAEPAAEDQEGQSAEAPEPTTEQGKAVVHKQISKTTNSSKQRRRSWEDTRVQWLGDKVHATLGTLVTNHDASTFFSV